eukprot:2006816-Pleurochrysis_carterae.AAC.1
MDGPYACDACAFKFAYQSGIIRLRSPTTPAAHACTHEAARPDQAAAASRPAPPHCTGGTRNPRLASTRVF